MRPRTKFTAMAVGGVLFVGAGAVIVGPTVYETFASPAPIDPPTLMAEENALAAPSASQGTSVRQQRVTQPEPAHPFHGSWVVASGSQADYRITEHAGEDSATFTGSTHEVTGELKLDERTLEDVTFRVDVASLAASSSGENRAVFEAAIQSDKYPEAEFRLHQPVSVSALPHAGETVECEFSGEFTIGGVTHFTTFIVSIKNVDGAFELIGEIPVDLASLDHGESAAVEFHLVLGRQ